MSAFADGARWARDHVSVSDDGDGHTNVNVPMDDEIEVAAECYSPKTGNPNKSRAAWLNEHPALGWARLLTAARALDTASLEIGVTMGALDARAPQEALEAGLNRIITAMFKATKALDVGSNPT